MYNYRIAAQKCLEKGIDANEWVIAQDIKGYGVMDFTEKVRRIECELRYLFPRSMTFRFTSSEMKCLYVTRFDDTNLYVAHFKGNDLISMEQCVYALEEANVMYHIITGDGPKGMKRVVVRTRGIGAYKNFIGESYSESLSVQEALATALRDS